MSRFQVAHATGNDWQGAASACLAALGAVPAGANLGFLYVTDHLAGDVDAILARLRRETGIADWVGTAGIGVSANDGSSGEPREYYDCPAMALLVGSFPTRSYCVFEPVHGGLGPFRSAHGDWLGRAAPIFGVVHGDPRNPLTPSIVAELAEATGSFLVGGLTSSRVGFPQIAERVVEGGVSGVLFAGEVAVATGLSQGCSPIGPMRTVTDGEANLVKSIDDKPALEALMTDIGVADMREIGRAAQSVHVALPVQESDTGDYLVRNLIGIDPMRGWIAIGDRVSPGDRLMFTRRDRAGAEQDLRRMLDRLARRAGPAVKGGVYYSCVARGPNLFGPDSEELKLIRDRIGDVPLVGFFANGEICHNRLYGYTGVLALFL